MLSPHVHNFFKKRQTHDVYHNIHVCATLLFNSMRTRSRLRQTRQHHTNQDTRFENFLRGETFFKHLHFCWVQKAMDFPYCASMAEFWPGCNTADVHHTWTETVAETVMAGLKYWGRKWNLAWLEKYLWTALDVREETQQPNVCAISDRLLVLFVVYKTVTFVCLIYMLHAGFNWTRHQWFLLCLSEVLCNIYTP